MHHLRTWQERVRRFRERPLGELVVSWWGFVPMFALGHEIAGTLGSATVIGIVIALAVVLPLEVCWRKIRGTSKPMLLLPVSFELVLVTGLTAGAVLFMNLVFSPRLWQTVLLVLLFVAIEAVYRLTMPHSWTATNERLPHDPSLVFMDHVQKPGGEALSAQQR